MRMLAKAFDAHICDKYQTFMNWPKIVSLSLHLHPFLMQSANAQARLRECAGSPGLSLLAYAIST